MGTLGQFDDMCVARYRRVACVILFAFLCRAAAAQSLSNLTPSDVEAAYLYNFGKFIQWPDRPDAAGQAFSICILGQDNFGRRLDDLIAEDTIQGRKIVARRLASIDEAGPCQIVYIGQSENARVKRDLDLLQKKPVLTVGSDPQFLDHGGMIQFVLENRRVRFAVNLAAAQRNGLVLSSQLLKVAVHVTTEPGHEVQP